MDRRAFISSITVGLFATPFVAEAQDRAPPSYLRTEMIKTARGAGNGTKTAHEPIIEMPGGDAAAQVIEIARDGGHAPVAQLDRATVS